MKRFIAQLVLVLSMMSCASTPYSSPHRFSPVKIINRSTETVTVWAHHEYGGQLRRMSATSLRTTRDRIPFSLSKIVYFVVHPVGTRIYYRTPSVMPLAGQTIVLEVYRPSQFTTTWLQNY